MYNYKIAIIGNMNNSFIALVRYLRDAGHEAHLFYELHAEHFQPKADCFDLDFQNYCFEVNWSVLFEQGTPGPIINSLRNYDFLIGQGNEAAYAAWAGYVMNIYFPYGSDFYKYAWLPHEFSLRQKIYIHFFRRSLRALSAQGTLAKYIFKAITEAENVFLDYSNPEYESKLTSLPLKGKFEHVPMPFLYVPQYRNRSHWDVHWKSTIDEIRQKNEFVVLYHGRQEWKRSESYDNNEFTTKNTHYLIEGFASFLSKQPKSKSVLVLLQYGNDVDHSKELIESLNIRNNVIWLPKMYRKDLMYLIKQSDLCCGEFGRSYLTFGTIIEAMAMGKPVVHFRDDILYFDKYPWLYPLYNARESAEITNALSEAFLNEDKRIQMGNDAQRWVEEYFIHKPLSRIRQVLELKDFIK